MMQNKQLTVIDTSSLFYSVSFHSKKHNLSLNSALAKFSEWFESILIDTNCNDYLAFTDRSSTFRHKLLPDFKADRVYQDLPFKREIKEYGIDKYSIISHPELESDDLVILHHEHLKNDYDITIASPDSDLRQIPARFFNYQYRRNNTAPIIDIEQSEADLNLYISILAGSHNGLKGLPRLGKKTAEKCFDESKNLLDVYTKGYKKIAGLGDIRGVSELYRNYVSSYLLRSKEECDYLGIEFDYSIPIEWKVDMQLNF